MTMASKPYFVAEIGPNHNGSLSMALELLDLAASSGANCAKFQLGIPDSVYSLDSFKADYQIDKSRPESIKEMSSRLQLTRDDHRILYARACDIGIAYACTAFDIDSLVFLNENFDLPFLKIPSGEILSIDLLEYVSKTTKPIILSTGMASIDEIHYAVDVLTSSGNQNLTILHCVSEYPANPLNLNLAFIRTLQRLFKYPVGYSDHSLGSKAIELSHAMGCNFFEKHFTKDKTLPGPDHLCSATPVEFREMVELVNGNSAYLGSCLKRISPPELSIRDVARKSIVASRDLFCGHVLTSSDVVFKRPGTGLSPVQLSSIIGKKLNRDVSSDRVLKAEYIMSDQ